MAKQLLLRRGTSADNDAFTGEQGEITFDNTNNRLRVHNGIKEGGYEIPRSNEVIHLSGNETIEGTKTFSTNPIVPTPTSDTHAVTKKYVDDRVIPAGLIAPYGGSSAPTGWLMCNGQAVSRTTYATLFNKIGTAYGAGDGSTTFNLPDYANRVAQGLGTGYLNAGLPQITGSFDSHNNSISGGTGCFVPSDYQSSAGLGGVGSFPHTMTFKASSSNSIYGKSSTVQPASVKTYWIIKY